MSVSFLGNNRKVMRYGYSDVPRMSDMLGHFRACVFTPDDLSLVKGAPEERRRFADISISQISPRFVHCLNDYFRVLAQKNAILKKQSDQINEMMKCVSVFLRSNTERLSHFSW